MLLQSLRPSCQKVLILNAAQPYFCPYFCISQAIPKMCSKRTYSFSKQCDRHLHLFSQRMMIAFDRHRQRATQNISHADGRQQRWNGGLGRAVVLHDRDGHEGLAQERREIVQLRLRRTSGFCKAYSRGGSGACVRAEGIEVLWVGEQGVLLRVSLTLLERTGGGEPVPCIAYLSNVLQSH